MGVRGLLSYCSPIQKRVFLQPTDSGPPIAASRVAMDAYGLFYLVKDNMERARAYLSAYTRAGYSLTLVVDRRASQQKGETVKRREHVRAEAKAAVQSLHDVVESAAFQDLSPQEQAVLQRRLHQKEAEAWHFSPALLERYKILCRELTIQLEFADEEADTALAAGVHAGLWDIIVSGDSDLLLLRVPRLWIFTARADCVKEIVYTEFLRFMCLTGDQVVTLALLAGSDVSPRPICSISQAVSWLRYYGSLEAIHARLPEQLTCEDMVRWKEIAPLYLSTATV